MKMWGWTLPVHPLQSVDPVLLMGGGGRGCCYLSWLIRLVDFFSPHPSINVEFKTDGQHSQENLFVVVMLWLTMPLKVGLFYNFWELNIVLQIMWALVFSTFIYLFFYDKLLIITKTFICVRGFRHVSFKNRWFNVNHMFTELAACHQSLCL